MSWCPFLFVLVDLFAVLVTFRSTLYCGLRPPAPRRSSSSISLKKAARVLTTVECALDDGWPESEKGKDVDVKYIEERRRCEKISEERMNI